MGLEKLIGGFGNRYSYKDHRSSGYGFEEHKEFVSHEESERGFSDHQAHYDHHLRLPANHGRPTMAVCDEEDSDSDVEEFFEGSHSHHTTMLPHHQQQPHLNFMPPPPMAQPQYHGRMSKGWRERHGAHGMQHYGHQDRLMAPQIPPYHVYANPIQQQHMLVSNSGGYRKAGWGSKGL